MPASLAVPLLAATSAARTLHIANLAAISQPLDRLRFRRRASKRILAYFRYLLRSGHVQSLQR